MVPKVSPSKRRFLPLRAMRGGPFLSSDCRRSAGDGSVDAGNVKAVEGFLGDPGHRGRPARALQIGMSGTGPTRTDSPAEDLVASELGWNAVVSAACVDLFGQESSRMRQTLNGRAALPNKRPAEIRIPGP